MAIVVFGCTRKDGSSKGADIPKHLMKQSGPFFQATLHKAIKVRPRDSMECKSH